MNFENYLQSLRNQGRLDALYLRQESPNLTGTDLIAREDQIPPFDPGKDYTCWAPGNPVTDDGQVWVLMIPHNAAHYPGLRPGDNRACWGLAHTKDPAHAKPWVAPLGTSGLYREGECCIWEGVIYRNLFDGNPYSPEASADRWEVAL